MKFNREEVNVNTVFYNQLKELLPTAEIFYEEPMSKHTTFRIGGAADVFIKISEEEQLIKLVPYLAERGISYYVIGKGSNLLVGDKGFRGVVIQLYKNFDGLQIKGTTVTAKSGAMLIRVAKESGKAGLTGLEFASGIPGTIGGAMVMNAGAYGGELRQVISSVKMLDEDGNEVDLQRMEEAEELP